MKKHCDYSALPYKIFNFRNVGSKYKKLSMLKEALGFGDSEELNEDLIFNFVSEHNYHEFYLMEYIINRVIYAPKEITAQNFILISLYEEPEAYKRQYEITKKLYKTSRVFKDFANSIKKDLELHDRDNCKLFNYQVYEMCSRYIDNEIILEPTEVHLNLHLMQKWIFEQTNLRLEPFTDVEKAIIRHLKSGYSVYELTKEDLIKNEEDKSFLNTIVHYILPAKCRVETINQVMATICCHYPNPAKIEPLPQKGIKELKAILEKWGFGDCA